MGKYKKSLECSKLQRCWTVKDSKTLLCMTKNGKYVLNPEEVYKIIKDHFKHHFYEESIESLLLFGGQQENTR